MSLTSTLPRSQFIAAQNQVLFPYGFKILSASELGVYKNQSLLVLQVHYTVTGVGQANGGNVVMFSLSTAGDEIVIVGSRTYDQAATYIPSDPFPAAAHEAALDKVTRLTQQVKEELNRAVTLRVTSLMSGIKLPEASSFTTSQGGKKAVVWNTSGNQLELAELVPPGPTTSPLPTGSVNILDYGAIGDGVVDNATAIAAALSAAPSGGEVIIPPGIYAYTGTITLTKTVLLRGLSTNLSILRPMTPNVPGLSIGAAFCTLRDFRMQRTIKPVAGGDGVVVSGIQSHIVIERVSVAKGGYRGFVLAPTDISYITQADASFCESHGFDFNYTDSPGVGMQWHVTRCIAGSNLADGFHAVNLNSTNGIGPWFIDCVTWNNGWAGYNFSSVDTAHPLNDILMLRCLSSGDANYGVLFFDTHGHGHMAQDLWIELVGTYAGTRGFDETPFAATNTGYGLSIVGANGPASNFVGGLLWNNSWAGIRLDSTDMQVVGFTCVDNGQGQSAQLDLRAGIAIFGSGAGAASCTFVKTAGNNSQSKAIVYVGSHGEINLNANKFSGYELVDRIDTSMATIAGALQVAYPLGLSVSTDRLPFVLRDEATGAVTPKKFLRVANGSLEILSDAFSIIAALTNAGQLWLFDAASGTLKPVLFDTADLGSGVKKYLYLTP